MILLDLGKKLLVGAVFGFGAYVAVKGYRGLAYVCRSCGTHTTRLYDGLCNDCAREDYEVWLGETDDIKESNSESDYQSHYSAGFEGDACGMTVMTRTADDVKVYAMKKKVPHTGAVYRMVSISKPRPISELRNAFPDDIDNVEDDDRAVMFFNYYFDLQRMRHGLPPKADMKVVGVSHLGDALDRHFMRYIDEPDTEILKAHELPGKLRFLAGINVDYSNVKETTIPPLLMGGRGDDLQVGDVDSEELRKGIEIEYEHTWNRGASQKIALDHLAEIRDYYTRLIRMEHEAEDEGTAIESDWKLMGDYNVPGVVDMSATQG